MIFIYLRLITSQYNHAMLSVQDKASNEHKAHRDTQSLQLILQIAFLCLNIYPFLLHQIIIISP